MFLYLDTSKHLTVGLLSESGEWLCYEKQNDVKSSSIIHAKINDICLDNGIEVKDLEGLISAAGPGSYTGMRVSEGISQVMQWQGIKTFGFYHFEIPSLFGVGAGKWLAQAFKGEFFCYSWNGKEVERELLNQESFDKLVKSLPVIYTHHEGELKDLECTLTSQMIEENGEILLREVVARDLKREPFYYRSLEEEFKPISK